MDNREANESFRVAQLPGRDEIDAQVDRIIKAVIAVTKQPAASPAAPVICKPAGPRR